MTWNHKEDSGNAAPYRSDWVDFFCFFLCVWLLIFALAVAGLRSHDRGQVKGTRGMDTRTHSIHTTLFPTPASSPTSPWVQKPGTRQLFQPSGGRITTGHTVREKQRCRGRKRLRFVYAKRYISYECEAFFHQFHVEFCLETGIVMLCAHCNLCFILKGCVFCSFSGLTLGFYVLPTQNSLFIHWQETFCPFKHVLSVDFFSFKYAN